jgi:peptidoglycan hydrolase-like protein with peptidoglycan-binding domain
VPKPKKQLHRQETPRSSKPFAVSLSSAAVLGSCAMLFNVFFGQAQNPAKQLANLEDGSTRVTVTADNKTSRTITLKYDALVEDVQRELMATGHFTGLVDGVTGPKTRVAIEVYQRENDMDVTGEVSKPLLEHIQYKRKINQAAEFTGSIAPKESIVQPLAALPKPEKKTVEKPKSVGDNAILKVQERLAKLGYDPGSRSGNLDEGTRSAILIFEMDHNLPMEGKISKTLLATLKTVEGKAPKKP